MSELMSIKKWFPSHVAAGVSEAGHGIGGDLPCPHFILSDILKSKITFLLPCISTLTFFIFTFSGALKRALEKAVVSAFQASEECPLYSLHLTAGRPPLHLSALHLSLVTPESTGIWIIARVSSSPHSASPRGTNISNLRLRSSSTLSNIHRRSHRLTAWRCYWVNMEIVKHQHTRHSTAANDSARRRGCLDRLRVNFNIKVGPWPSRCYCSNLQEISRCNLIKVSRLICGPCPRVPTHDSPVNTKH